MYEMGFPLGEYGSLVIRRGDAQDISIEIESLSKVIIYQISLSLYTAVDFLKAIRAKEAYFTLEDKFAIFKFYFDLSSLVVMHKDHPTSVQLYSFDAYKIDFILALWGAVLPEYKDRLGFDTLLNIYKNKITVWEKR